jgi:hypothetical protein
MVFESMISNQYKLYDEFIFLALFNGLQVIDLTRVSQELAYLANDADLVVLEGMVSSSLGIIGNFYYSYVGF